jgi:release factor glutamine methyltransferase
MTEARQGSWTILEILRRTAAFFEQKGVSEPRASAEVLLAHALKASRLELYLKHDQPLTPEELARFRALVVRRRQGEPVAYLTGRKEFWSLAFKVTPAVLIPRPETEILVEAALAAARGPDFPREAAWGLVVGVGSGAVVVALARELPQMRWVAVDLSAAALEVARENAADHGVDGRIAFLQADLLAGLQEEARFALLVANLPYVPRAEWQALPRDIRDFEPKEALEAGEDGLKLIRPLARQAHRYLKPGGFLTLEVGPGQAQQVMGFLEETAAYHLIEAVNDYHEVNRVVRGRRRHRS